MKLSELEDSDKLVTKDFLKGELQQLREDLLEQQAANQMRELVAGPGLSVLRLL